MKGDPGDYLEDLYNELDLQAKDYELDIIVDHHFKDSILILKAMYQSKLSDSKNVWEMLFNTLKKDAPLEVARYIQNYVTEASRQDGYYNT
eukprot:1318859-Ditylum_brightwellii.AAC.1